MTLPGKLLATLPLLLTMVVATGCDDDDPTAPNVQRPFFEGTEGDAQIGFVLNSTGNALRLFQLGDPSVVEEIPLGASSAVTPIRLAASVSDRLVAVGLGNAASVAVIDIETLRIDRFFLFEGGNASDAAFTGDGHLLVSNLNDHQVGRVSLDQASNQIGNLVDVTTGPVNILLSDDRALVISDNIDDTFTPIGPGVVTALDPTSMQIQGTLETGGNNPQDAELGPDGLLYVVNTGDYVSPGSLAIIDPATLTLVELIDDAGVGPGSITVDDDGLAYISGFFSGTLVFDTGSRSWVRGPDNPVCAPLEGGGCRGAFDASAAEDGTLYQAFFGSTSQGLSPYIFVYEPGTFALTDSIASGQGPTAMRIEAFRE